MVGAGKSLRWVVAVFTLVWLTVGAVACSKQGPAGDGDLATERRTPALVAMSIEHHKLADLALDQGDRAEAKRQMSELLDHAERYRVRSAEGRDVTFDAATRLARMNLEDDDLDAAEAAARRGLRDEESAPPSLFRGYLHQVLGDVLERRDDLRGAVAEHEQAIKIFKAILEAEQPPGGPSETP